MGAFLNLFITGATNFLHAHFTINPARQKATAIMPCATTTLRILQALIVVVDISEDTDGLVLFLLILKSQAVLNIYTYLPYPWIALYLYYY